MKSIQALREQRKAKAREARNLLDQNPGDKWTDEVNAKYEGLVDEIDRIDADIERHERIAGIESRGEQRTTELHNNLGVSTDEAAALAQRESRVFDRWLRNGMNGLNQEDIDFVRDMRSRLQNTMSTTTGSEGGYTVPTEFARQLIQEMASFGGMREVATILPTMTGAAFPWPTTDDTAEEGEIVGENAQVGTGDATFGVKSLGSFKYSSKTVTIPFELLQDTGIDIEGHVRQRLVKRIQRITNKHFTVGVGTTQPTGAVTASTLGKTGLAGQTTSIIYDDLIDLEHSVDPAYRMNPKCRFMFHDTTLKVLKKLKDSQGRPLWIPGLAVKEPDTILQYPYVINQHMPVMAASAKSILFGDFSYYHIRDVMQVLLFRMTDSKYTEKGQVGFLAFSRHDGNLMDAAGKSIKHYANSAT